MKPKIRLRSVPPTEHRTAPMTHAEKLAKAIAYLRSRGRYVLDQGSQKPAWGVPGASGVSKGGR